MPELQHAPLAIHADPAGVFPHREAAARRVRRAAMCVIGLLLCGAVAALAARDQHANAIAVLTQAQNKQYVLTVQPVSGASSERLELPGTLQGMTESPIAARTSGYVIGLHADIGSAVKRGALLAEISSPEADQQLAQAQAGRVQSVATAELARSSLARWETLRSAGAVSLQAIDERRSAAAQAGAALTAVDANIERLRQLQGFKRITAPFDGIITRRNANVGDLIDAGGAGRALFVLTQSAPLRVLVQVPQAYAQRLAPGASVTVTQDELPGQLFEATITRTAKAIDSASRSLQTEISMPNGAGKLLPGAYVTVALSLSLTDALTVPANTLLLRGEGPRIAVVDAAGKVSLRAVTIGKDFGQTVQVTSGIAANDKLVLNPADSLSDGDIVVASAAPKRAKKL